MKVDKTQWEKCKLEDICTNGTSNIVISKIDIGNGDYALYGASRLIGNIDFYHQDKEYIGIVKDGSGIGRVAKYPAFSSLVGTMQYIFPKDNINIDYLHYILESLHLAKYVKGTAIPHIYFRHYKSEQIRIPLIEEQKLIASELNAIQTVIDGYKAQLEDLDALAQSIFLDMFGDPVSNPKRWDERKLSDVCEVTSSKRIYQSEQTKSGVPFYRISDLTQLIKGVVIVPELYISQEKYKELKNINFVPLKDDILITSRGTLGLCYIIKESDCFYFQDGMITWLKGIRKNLSSTFLSFIIRTPRFKEHMQKVQNGSTVAYLSISMIKGFYIPIPPFALQQQFASKIEAIERQKEQIRLQLKDAETLMAERMQYYFS